MAIATATADVTPPQLERYARLIYDKVGIAISPQKTTLLSNRLRRRIRATGVGGYDEYFDVLKKAPADDPEWDAFLQEITTHETYLFRDEAHWAWLRDVFVPEVVSAVRAGERQPRLRVWSAACSTGDEATTIACCLADRIPLSTTWKIEVLGTDVGVGAVAQARQLHFGERAMRLVPPAYRQKFFEKVANSPAWTPKAVVRDMLRFDVHNLLQPMREPKFDLIVLKNVLIYFDAASKKRVLTNIRQAMGPGGSLITGAAEGVSELVVGLKSSQGWLHRMPAAR